MGHDCDRGWVHRRGLTATGTIVTSPCIVCNVDRNKPLPLDPKVPSPKPKSANGRDDN